ncbi:hypothetical protein [Streptomyces eurythermus]|uniref:hypothetical protein n=1 Tax=Streptomyces eurythermus TaxID=42237 RepID=UPI0036D3E341
MTASPCCGTGSYHSPAQYAECAHANDAPPGIASPGIGLRPVRSTAPTPPTRGDTL